MNTENELIELSMKYLKKNYDYTWLKTMLLKARNVIKVPGSTLITGSSHALYGFDERIWSNAVNISMHSQDIYYDYLCAKRVIENSNHKITKCFIVLGYYIAYQDLSRSNIMREKMITKVYYPIFGDAHNWKEPYCIDRWKEIGNYTEQIKSICENMATIALYDSTYFSDIRKRGGLFDFGQRSWADLEKEERDHYGKERAEMHNKVMKHSESLRENTQIMREYIEYLTKENIRPIVVVTPFTKEYNRYVDLEMKNLLINMLSELPQEIDYVDFNNSDLFDDTDFIDTDHLNEKGAKKVSEILVDMFGR